MRAELTERREFRRHRIKNGLAAEINTGAESLIGLVMDISQKGLAFRCLDPEERIKDSRASFTLAVISSAEEIVLLDVHCRLSLDPHPIPEYSISCIPMRRCRVKFSEMSPGQITQVEYIMERYAEG